MPADDDVSRLDVAVQHAAGVSVFNGVANVHEPLEQFSQFERPSACVLLQALVGVEAVAGILEAVATDEPHRVVRAAIAVRSQAVNRDDARVL
jgi:hypothetical protein